MRHRIFFVAFLTTALVLFAPDGRDGMPGGMAFAEGGGRVDDTTPPKPRNTQPPETPQTQTAPQTTQTAPRGVSPCFNYKQSKIRKIRDVQTKIAGYAKKDKLKGLATTKKRLENFVKQINAMGNSYSGWKSIEFNLIFQQMQCYANQKQDKALRKWARGILRAFEVLKLRDLAEVKREKVKKAIKEKNLLTEAFARAEYSDARGDYHRAAKKLPPEMIALLDPLPKDPAK